MATVEGILRETAGNPSTGVISDIIPGFAQAIEANFDLTPKKAKPEQRVVVASETRTA